MPLQMTLYSRFRDKFLFTNITDKPLFFVSCRVLLFDMAFKSMCCCVYFATVIASKSVKYQNDGLFSRNKKKIMTFFFLFCRTHLYISGLICLCIWFITSHRYLNLFFLLQHLMYPFGLLCMAL